MPPPRTCASAPLGRCPVHRGPLCTCLAHPLGTCPAHRPALPTLLPCASPALCPLTEADGAPPVQLESR